MSLSLHYNIDIDAQRRLVISKIYGIWKEETARDYHEDYKKIVKPLLTGPWSKLTLLTNWKSSYPEIIEIIGEHMRWCHENGAVFSLYVIDNPITTNQLNRMIEKSNAAQIARLFKTLDEANKFLKENDF
jgi:hypothetical protein